MANNSNTNGQSSAQKSDQEILNDLAKGSTTGGSSSKGIAPQVEVIEGVITKVEDVTPKDGSNPFHIVTLGKDTQVIVNRTTMLRDKAILAFGNTVVATCERRIPGKTGYVDADGKWQLHKGQGGLSLNKVTLTEAKAVADAAVRDKVAEQALMHGAKVDAISAVMDNIKSRIGDDPQALATAFAGAFAAIK